MKRMEKMWCCCVSERMTYTCNENDSLPRDSKLCISIDQAHQVKVGSMKVDQM